MSDINLLIFFLHLSCDNGCLHELALPAPVQKWKEKIIEGENEIIAITAELKEIQKWLVKTEMQLMAEEIKW